MVSHDWDKFWPQGGPARTEMLDWFNSRTGNILRQQISFAESDLPLIYRTERALQLICDKLQQVDRLFSGCRLSIVVVAGLSGAAATVTG